MIQWQLCLMHKSGTSKTTIAITQKENHYRDGTTSFISTIKKKKKLFLIESLVYNKQDPLLENINKVSRNNLAKYINEKVKSIGSDNGRQRRWDNYLVYCTISQIMRHLHTTMKHRRTTNCRSQISAPNKHNSESMRYECSVLLAKATAFANLHSKSGLTRPRYIPVYGSRLSINAFVRLFLVSWKIKEI